jgi:hypothetical protein
MGVDDDLSKVNERIEALNNAQSPHAPLADLYAKDRAKDAALQAELAEKNKAPATVPAETRIVEDGRLPIGDPQSSKNLR